MCGSAPTMGAHRRRVDTLPEERYLSGGQWLLVNLSPDRARRRDRLTEAHRKGFERFHRRLRGFESDGHLDRDQIDVLLEHLLRLGERDRNPANTGNIEDLFCHTLTDTGDAIRAYAQALADSVKVVPMDPQAKLLPALRTPDGAAWFHRVGDLAEMSEPDRMLVTHTMVAYGDDEMWSSASDFVRATHKGFTESEVDREVAKMAVQSQHLPSSSFVLARARGLTLDCGPLWARAGFSAQEGAEAQRFFDICATFDPTWTETFLDGLIPTSSGWRTWRREYLQARTKLPEELIYQLSSDTLTNFLDGTLESGKWTDASVAFHGVRDPNYLPDAIARIVNQYVAEHVALHDRPAREIAAACAKTLLPWGIA
ncbi:MAG: hypothetical protein AAFU79_36065, partial [Myxococcota bacterium]